MTKMTEFIGDLRTEFQEIEKMYEHEEVMEEIQSITGECIQLYTIICC